MHADGSRHCQSQGSGRTPGPKYHQTASETALPASILSTPCGCPLETTFAGGAGEAYSRTAETSRQRFGASTEVMELCAGGELYDRWADKGREDGVKQDEQQRAFICHFSDGASDQHHATSRAGRIAGGYFNEDEATTAVRPGKLTIGVPYTMDFEAAADRCQSEPRQCAAL